MGPGFVWSAVEPSISILLASLMMSMPAFSRLWKIVASCSSIVGLSRDTPTRDATQLSLESNVNLHNQSASFSTYIKRGEIDEIALSALDEEQTIGTKANEGKNRILVTRHINTTVNYA